MGRLLEHKQCPKCAEKGNDNAGNNLGVYDDGVYCFACGFSDGLDQHKERRLDGLTKQYVPLRGLTRETCEFFGLATLTDEAGRPLYVQIPWDSGRQYKSLLEKKFWSEGDMSSGQLFGEHLFPAGSAKAITVTEGAFDAAAAYQMFGSKYPVVSIRSSSSAKKDAATRFEYLNSFEEVYLCFDNDDAGRAATRAVASLFPFEKVKHVQLTKHKDANDFLIAGDAELFRKIWWNSRRFVPDTIVSDYQDIDKILEDKLTESIAEYPFGRIQAMTYGIRPGELILIKAMEGHGKTEFLRALEYHLLKSTAHNIGIIHLEESQARSVKGLIGYELCVPAHYPDCGVDIATMKSTYRLITGNKNDRVSFFKHFGSGDPDDVISAIRFMVASAGCRVVFLDHISILVSGLEMDDERRTLDNLSTRLKMLAEELQFTLVFVSHVNDEGQTRGSRNISKIADLIIKLDRDVLSEDENKRNTTYLTVEKNRFAANTGPAGSIYFDVATFKLSDSEDKFGLPV